MRRRNQRLGRNDPCWCQSGKKFKDCHYGREHEKPLPLGAVGVRLQTFFNAKECLHPAASEGVCEKVIAAHTIQRRGALGRITNRSGHCLTLFSQQAMLKQKPVKRGWKEASTFYGFCARHDASTFEPLESTPFVGSPEQTFLLAYRAECHELYQKQASHRSQEPLRSLLDRGRPRSVQEQLQSMYNDMGEDVKAGLGFARHHKARMDRELVERSFDAWDRLFVRFAGPVSVVSTGAASLDNALPKWRPANFRRGEVIERIYLAVVQTDEGGAVVLTWRPNVPRILPFIAAIEAMPRDVLPGVLVQLMFAYIENTYFSDEWWQSLSEGQRRHVVGLAFSEAYYTPFAFMPDLPVPWQVTDVSHQWTR